MFHQLKHIPPRNSNKLYKYYNEKLKKYRGYFLIIFKENSIEMLERYCFCYKVIVNHLSNHTRVNIDIVCVKTVRTEKESFKLC